MARYEQQLERVRRYLRRVDRLYQGVEHNRPNEELLDDVYSFFVNAYNLKDWLKNDPTFPKRNDVESYVSNTPVLALCGDIANSIKHLLLNKVPKTGVAPTFPPAEIIVDLFDSFSATESAEEEPTMISLRVFVEHNGNIEDVRDLAREIVAAWEAFIV